MLDDAFGKNRRDSQYELMDNHFGQVEERNFSQNDISQLDLTDVSKFLVFLKTK
jgi:hypothetical protein